MNTSLLPSEASVSAILESNLNRDGNDHGDVLSDVFKKELYERKQRLTRIRHKGIAVLVVFLTDMPPPHPLPPPPSLSLSWTSTANQRSTKTRTARVRTPSPPIRHVDRRPRGLSEGPWPPSIITRGPGGHPRFLAHRPFRE